MFWQPRSRSVDPYGPGRDEVAMLHRQSAADAHSVMEKTVSRALNPRFAPPGKLAERDMQEIFRLICRTAGRGDHPRVACIFPLANYRPGRRRRRRRRCRKLAVGAPLVGEGGGHDGEDDDSDDDSDNDDSDDDSDNDGDSDSLRAPRPALGARRERPALGRRDDSDTARRKGRPALGARDAVRAEWASDSEDSSGDERDVEADNNDGADAAPLGPAEEAEAEYCMPQGNATVYHGDARLDPRMFDPDATCEYMMLFRVQDTGTGRSMLADDADVERVTQFLANDDNDDPSLPDVSLSTVYGLDMSFTNLAEADPDGDPFARLGSVGAHRAMYDAALRTGDCAPWRARVGGSRGRAALVRLPDDDDDDDEGAAAGSLYIMVHAGATQSSRELHAVVAHYAATQPDMTLAQFMRHLPWYEMHKKNSYRNACRIGYQFAAMLGLDIVHRADTDSFVGNAHAGVAPRMGVPSVLQCINSMEDTSFLRPELYRRYLERLQEAAARGVTIGEQEACTFFRDNRDGSHDGAVYTYFNRCAMNEFYHPFAASVRRGARVPGGAPTSSVDAVPVAYGADPRDAHAAVSAGPLMQRTIVVVDTSEPVRVVSRVFHTTGAAGGGRLPGGAAPRIPAGARACTAGLRGAARVARRQAWRAPGFIAVPCFSVRRRKRCRRLASAGAVGDAAPAATPRRSLTAALIGARAAGDTAAAAGGVATPRRALDSSADESAGAPHRPVRLCGCSRTRKKTEEKQKRERQASRYEPFATGILPQLRAMHHVGPAPEDAADSISGPMWPVATT